ncbi:mitotic and meiotic cohesin loader subunit Pds5 [Schizosaccharomyces osmophilus]|uniref:Mitotic and meiotic cohesin loader subunit Pds5 n=1 Tax=Schizosaccharomyces osmophilus TaxID=2545709 RepID=A0AAF0AWP5_9SCHI|nr:mitotic and meiotic cohesin loader subunit Pds5 [Schizosaccharomyces osmophilus]WBW73235.1 mitotic and meiotic cohesin loader subunit Pds5 [Schizosaccharomyces osmophilus]
MIAMSKLKFKQVIVPSHDKPIPTTELVKRLRSLLDELSDMEQETTDRDSLLPVASSLVNQNLLHHRDKGIRSFVGCCIVELLRLCAPDAPYTLSQLEEIFQVILKLLSGLENSESTYYLQVYRILESLSNVKSAVLMVDLPNAESFLVTIFRLFFDISRKGTNKNVEFYMLDIIHQLINEINSVPQVAMNILFAQLISGHGVREYIGSPDSQNHGPAFQLARNIFRDSSDRLQRYVCQYFSDIVFDTKDSVSDEKTNPEFIFAHNLVIQLWEYAPLTLLNIVPQFENELQAEQTSVRRVAIQTVRLMLPNHSLWSDYPKVWAAFCGRLNDKVTACRVDCVEKLMDVLRNPLASSDVTNYIIQLYQGKLADTDEKVRIAALQAIGHVSLDIIKTHVPVEILKLMGDRLRDKKLSVRIQAIQTLSKIYHIAFPGLEAGEEVSIQLFSWIPSSLLEVFYINDEATNTTVDLAMNELVLQQLNSDTDTRVNRLLVAMNHFSEKALRVFFMLQQRQLRFSGYCKYFIECCKNYNGGVMDENEEEMTSRLKKVIGAISLKTVNPSLNESSLQKFADTNDRQAYKMLMETFSPKNDYQTVLKNVKHLFKRVSASMSTQHFECFRLLVYRCALFVFNKTIVIELVNKIGSLQNNLQYAKSAELLLQQLPLIHPEIYEELFSSMESMILSFSLKADVKVLKTLSHFAKKKINFSVSPEVIGILKSLCFQGTDGQAKQAATVLAFAGNFFDLDSFVSEIIDGLHYDSSLSVRLSTLAQLVLYRLDAVEKHADFITECLVKEIIQMVPEANEDQNETEEWCDFQSLDHLYRCKVLAVKVLVNRLRAGYHSPEALEIAAPVLKLLNVILLTEGEISPHKNTSRLGKAHLRLIAGKSLLKLAAIPTYAEYLDFNTYLRTSLLCQDPFFDVRNAFIQNLQKKLQYRKLPMQFYAIIFLVVHDPEEEIITKMSLWICSQVIHFRKMHNYTMEYVITYLLHLLSHHPDISLSDNENVFDFVKYIQFYVENVASSDNIPIIFHLVQRIKQNYDAVEPERKYVYMLSDIAQKVIQTKAQSMGWSLTTYPKQVRLPSIIFKPFDTSEEKQKFFSKNFLTPEIESAIEHMVRSSTIGSTARLLTKSNATRNGNHEKLKRKRFGTRQPKPKKQERKNEEQAHLPRRASTRVSSKQVNYTEAESEKSENSEASSEFGEEE